MVLRNLNASEKLMMNNKKQIAKALNTLILPAAIGLNFLTGCILSDRTSATSFIIYTPLHSRLNTTTDKTNVREKFTVKAFLPKNAGKIINTFFTQLFTLKRPGKVLINFME